MANANKASGLTPTTYLTGTNWTGKTRTYYIASTDNNAFAIGDPVTLVSGGADTNGIAGVTLATAGTGNVVLGAIVSTGGIKYGAQYADPANLDSMIIPATKTKNYYVEVCDDPEVIFTIQEGGAGSALTVASVGKNFNLLSGANNSYVSGWQLNNQSSTTGATAQLQLMGLVQTVDNAPGAFAKWLVRIQNHQYNAGTAGV